MPPFLAAGELGVHLIETVSAVIEVKSIAKAAEVKKAVENVASVKRLISDEPRDHISFHQGKVRLGPSVDKLFGGILFLGCGDTQEAIFNAYEEATSKVAPNDRPSVLVVLDEFTLAWGECAGAEAPSPRLTIHPEPFRGTHLVMHELGVNSLLMFYAILIEMLSSYEPPPLNMYETYIKKGRAYGQYQSRIRRIPEDENQA